MKNIINKCNLVNEQTAEFYLVLLSHINSDMSSSNRALHKFFQSFYNILYKEPTSLGIEQYPKICFENGQHHSKSKEFKRIKDKVIRPVSDFLDMLYMIASQGTLKDDVIICDKIYLGKFLKSGKRQKRKLIEGVAKLGIKIMENDDCVTTTCCENPDLLKALHIFALKCSENIHEAGEICFRMCDFRALDTNYKPNIEDIFSKLYKNDELNNMLKLHNYMLGNGFKISYIYEPHVLNFEVRYTYKAVKSSPLLAFVLDFKRFNPLRIGVRFVATSRIVPIINNQPLSVQEDFYKTSVICNGCGWCKNQKGLLKPAVLKVGSDKKTICWYDVNEYEGHDLETIDLLIKYVDMHLEIAN